VTGTLTGAGPLFALSYTNDDFHAAAVRGLDEIALPMLTTWPCLGEAMCFVRKHIGWPGQRDLFSVMSRGDVVVLRSDYYPVSVVSALMERYADTPMDLAGASLVAAAMELDKLDVFTFDEHFRAYLGPRRRVFRVFPTS
jgi:predicted nucleic acid-binding protein